MHKALSALLLLACAVPASAETVLHARINADLIGSDPRGRRDKNGDAVLLHVVEGLVASREDGSVGPMLASGWTVSDDGRAYRFALRHDIVFHNGAPLTSADIVWAFDAYLAKDSHWRCKADLGPGGIAHIVSVKADGPYAVDIQLEHAAPLFLKTLARADCAGTGIFQRASIGADGQWRYPIGTGPFQWGDWVRNQHVDLLRFGGYRSLPGPGDGNGGGKRALVDRVRLEVIPDNSAASAALVRGSLDVLEGLAPNALAGLKDAPGIKFSSAMEMNLFSVLLQSGNPALSDVRLRRALALSIDVVGLARVSTHGTGIANSSPISAVSPFFGPAQRPLVAKNLKLARALVRASGYKGEPIQLVSSHEPPEMFDDAILVQAMAREAGINMQIVTLDWASQLARYQRGDYQAMVFELSPRLDPSFMYGVLIGKVWDKPVPNALYQRSMSEGDPKARQAIFDQMEAEFRRDVPAVILYNSRRVTALRSNVEGYRSWPAELMRLWNVGLGAH